MTVPRLTDYQEEEFTKGDTYRAIDHIGSMIVVKVKTYKERIVTENSLNGAPGIVVDLIDLETGTPYRDVLFMGGAFVDGLKRYMDGLVVVRIEARKSKSGRTYPAPIGVDGAGKARAEKFYADHGDPFAAAISTPSNDDKPPF